jgi:hypothetical protein
MSHKWGRQRDGDGKEPWHRAPLDLVASWRSEQKAGRQGVAAARLRGEWKPRDIGRGSFASQLPQPRDRDLEEPGFILPGVPLAA